MNLRTWRQREQTEKSQEEWDKYFLEENDFELRVSKSERDNYLLK